MPVTQQTYESAKGSIAYHRKGQGAEIWVCLHGSDQDGSAFSFLGAALTGKTLIAIDLPYHGNSHWKADEVLATDLWQIIRAIFLQEQITVAQFSLLGYSLGGRLALGIYADTPAAIKKLVLLAPDGFERSRWESFFTRNSFTRKALAWALSRPRFISILGKNISRLGLLNKAQVKFINSFLENDKSRQLVYHIWTGYRSIWPDIPGIRSIIILHQTPVRLLYGIHDGLMSFTIGQKFAATLQDHHVTVTTLPAGHHLLQERYAAAIQRLMDI